MQLALTVYCSNYQLISAFCLTYGTGTCNIVNATNVNNDTCRSAILNLGCKNCYVCCNSQNTTQSCNRCGSTSQQAQECQELSCFTDESFQTSICIMDTSVTLSSANNTCTTIFKKESNPPANNLTVYPTVQDSKTSHAYITSRGQVMLSPETTSTAFTSTMSKSKNGSSSEALVGVLAASSFFIIVVLILLLVGIAIITVIRRSE